MSTSVYTQLLNFRKMKHDFSPQIIREGKNLYEKSAVKSAVIVQFTDKIVKISSQVAGAYGNFYTCDIEIDRSESELLDSNCDCPHHCDCLHLACLIFYLEDNFEKLVLTHFEGKKKASVADGTKGGEVLKKVLKQAEKKANEKKEKERKKEDLQDYQTSAGILGCSSFFIPDVELHKEQGDISFLFIPRGPAPFKQVELQISLRLPYRSKPITIQSPKQFFSALQGQEPFMIGSNRYVFGVDSFGPLNEEVLKTLRQHVTFQETKDEKPTKSCTCDRDGFGEILACAFAVAMNMREIQKVDNEKESFSLASIFWESFDTPLLFSLKQAELGFALQYLTEPAPRLLLSPRVVLSPKNKLSVDETILLECSKPGVIVNGLYFRFPPLIKRQHLLEVESIQKMAIPEQLFGSFIENSLPELMRFAQVDQSDVIDKIATIPCSQAVSARCDLDYAQGQLEGSLHFVYNDCCIPEASQQLELEQINSFVTPQGILARNLVQENILVRDLFQGFIKDEKTGNFVATSEKRIVEFMTEVLPRNLDKVEFNCPETLQSRFAYDDTRFTLSLDQGSTFDRIEARLQIDGGLKNASVDVLWDCVSSRKTYIAIAKKGTKTSHSSEEEGLARFHKILVLQLEPLAAILQVFDELQIKRLADTTFELPLWILVNLLPERFVGLPLQVKLSPLLSRIQSQIFDPNVDGRTVDLPAVPNTVKATLRHYQKDGIDWLARLRCMGLNGILADDMGLGKTLQAIVAISQYFEYQKQHTGEDLPRQCLIVCPTSLVDNWKEEFAQFQPTLNVTTVVGNPGERKKILAEKNKHHVFITSYGLVQKDIELYEKIPFGYLILDEAQAIKNRETRNARSVKKIAARHRLILTGTPLENSLEDLWSLFDFLMPGLLGSPDRFVNTYIKPAPGIQAQLEVLRRKISPFVLRRMKKDVLEDLPTISHIVYHCHLSSAQQQLYSSYAKAATEQLTKLVEKEGFDKVRIHVLATLTRLKQICCHPAIFAKEQAEPGDSSKYEMLLDLVGGLIDSKHKTVIFSQYTRMLGILRDDLQKMGTKFAYLDGSSKNRLSIVKQFNEDESIPLFLVSLKAGGSGLNLVGADTVIHYDMWWNPAVENQATDRVWRLGQKQKVSSYKLITLGTIEEKILELQERKKELLKEIVNTDEEVISKLTWEEVLELLRM
ncbi:MAG: DEAD/DEAH box helicase family protein [Verrucomicrobia bacterium]|nr:DEAD/DEAH box helicase family protein [Verrucomicrobiota bacterium]